jgi:hypothetical protein
MNTFSFCNRLQIIQLKTTCFIVILLFFISYCSTGQKLGIGVSPSAVNPALVTVQTPTASNRLGLLHTDGTIGVASYLGNYQGTSYGLLGTTSAHPLSFFTGANPAAPTMTLSVGGWMGVGTTTPQAPLHIANTSVFERTTVIIGRNHTAGGYTAMYMGNTNNRDGYNYIQSVDNSGTSFGMLALNPYGGNNVHTGSSISPVDHTIATNVAVAQDVELNGVLKKQGSLTPLPLCIGVVSADGIKLSGTPNFTVHNGGISDYYITITGETITSANKDSYAVFVTTMGYRYRAKYEVFANSGNNIRITIYDARINFLNSYCPNACPQSSSHITGQPGQFAPKQFSFVVYKLY